MTGILTNLARPRIALVAALLTLSYFAAEWVVSATWRGHYSYRDDRIGPLGVAFCGTEGTWPCSALYPVLNVATVLTGLAIITLALSWIAARSVAATHGVLLAVAGAGFALSGIFTEQVSYPTYATGLAVFTVLGPIAILLIGASNTTRLPATAKLFAAVIGLLGIIARFAYTGHFVTVLGSGGTERVAVYAVLVAAIVLGVSGRNGRAEATVVPASPAELEEAEP